MMNKMNMLIYYLSKGLVGTKLHYAYVEKLALAVVFVVQHFRHYILLRTTTIIFDANPMQYILSRHILGGRYSKWIVILQEFDLEFSTAKSKKSLVFVELMTDLPRVHDESVVQDSLPDESLFLIDSSDPWYGDVLIYLQTQHVFNLNYQKMIVDVFTINPIHYLYCRRCSLSSWGRYGFASVFIHDEAERILNDYHSGACGGHLSRLATAQKILCTLGTFWPTIFKDCMNAVQKCHPCQIFSKNMHSHPYSITSCSRCRSLFQMGDRFHNM
jgi:hypothetical protein